jgi:hypothetical protein
MYLDTNIYDVTELCAMALVNSYIGLGNGDIARINKARKNFTRFIIVIPPSSLPCIRYSCHQQCPPATHVPPVMCTMAHRDREVLGGTLLNALFCQTTY